MANKYAGLGAQLKRGDGGGPEVFTIVASAKNLAGPKTDSTQIDTTTLDTVGGYETFVMGLLKPGTLQFELIWDPQDTQHKGLMSDYDGRTQRNFKIVWPDAGSETFSFAAFVKSWEPQASPQTALTVKFDLQITGAITRS